MYKVMSVFACLFVVGCADVQLNKNTTDLATSLGSLETRQILSNLGRAIKDQAYVPSQVILTLGSASTANGINPTFALPFGYGFSSGSTMGTGTSASTSLTGGTTLSAPTLSLQVTDTWNQSWTMTPPSEPGQLGRLRELYLYVAGYPKHSGKTGEAPDATPMTSHEREQRFLCNYPVQALAINFGALVQTPVPPAKIDPKTHKTVDFTVQERAQTTAATGGGADNGKGAGTGTIAPVNLVYDLLCPDLGKDTARSIYADPTFLTGADCVICLNVMEWNADGFNQEPGGIRVLRKYLYINPRLPFGLVHSDNPDGTRKPMTTPEGTTLYIDPENMAKFGDLAMFTHQALAQPASTTSGGVASGKSTTGNSPALQIQVR